MKKYLALLILLIFATPCFSGDYTQNHGGGSATGASSVEDRLKVTFYGSGTSVLTPNIRAAFTVPYPCEITGGQILATKRLGTSGVVSVVVDIWKESNPEDYDGGYQHPAVVDSIIGGGGTKPTVTANNYGVINVTGWASPSLAKGDILVFIIDSVTGAVMVDVTLYIRGI